MAVDLSAVKSGIGVSATQDLEYNVEFEHLCIIYPSYKFSFSFQYALNFAVYSGGTDPRSGPWQKDQLVPNWKTGWFLVKELADLQKNDRLDSNWRTNWLKNQLVLQLGTIWSLSLGPAD